MPTGHPMPIDVEALAALYKSGLSTRVIAAQFGTNHSTVRKRLAAMGIARRDNATALRGRPKGARVPWVTWTCPHCGTTKVLVPSDARERRFCSNACRARVRTAAGGGPPHKPPRLCVTHDCRQCGREFKGEADRKFCSRSCALRYNHHRRWGATVPERVAQALLVGMGVAFVAEWSLGSFRADLYLPDHSKAIECDGDYWHALPHAIAVGVRKTATFEAAGIPVLHLREAALRDDLAGCKAAVEAFLDR